MTLHLIGIDCATVDAKIGVARGELADGHVVVHEVRLCSGDETAAENITRWLVQNPQCPTLLAIDAPLGWPEELSTALIDHRAGQGISTDPNMMFRRETDRFVHAKLGKTPLEVGADRIARTAHSALRLLTDVRRAIGEEIPLAWSPIWSGKAAIEVYPAATLLAHKITAVGYKKRGQSVEREGIIQNLRSHLVLPQHCQSMIESADALDAAVCILSGADFVRGPVYSPENSALAEREGWIWFATNGDADSEHGKKA